MKQHSSPEFDRVLDVFAGDAAINLEHLFDRNYKAGGVVIFIVFVQVNRKRRSKAV